MVDLFPGAPRGGHTRRAIRSNTASELGSSKIGAVAMHPVKILRHKCRDVCTRDENLSYRLDPAVWFSTRHHGAPNLSWPFVRCLNIPFNES